MDLKTFVEETLCQLAEGVDAAQKRLAPLGVTVNPYFKLDGQGHLEKVNNPGMGKTLLHQSLQLQTVDFDVAVTAAAKDSAGGGFSIAVVMAKLGMGAQSETSSATVSRVRFQVVIDLPHHKAGGPQT